MPSWMICHFSSGDRSTRGFLLMLPPVFGGPESYRIRQSSFSGEHYTLGQTTVLFVLSTMPIWLGTLIVYATGEMTGRAGIILAIHSTIARGELFMYATA